MKKKFREFLASEEGRVGVKAPIAAGVVGGSLLLAQAMLATDAQAHMECQSWGHCDPGERCDKWWELEWSPDLGDWVRTRHSACVAD